MFNKVKFAPVACLQDPETKQLLLDLAGSARPSGSGSSQNCNERIEFVGQGLAGADMQNDKERHKGKTIYEGYWAATGSSKYLVTAPPADRSSSSSRSTLIKVTLSRVYDATKFRHGYEVAGTSPQLNDLLQRMLQEGGLSSIDNERVLQHLLNMLAFAKAAAARMADA